MTMYRIATVFVLVGTLTLSVPPAHAAVTVNITQGASEVDASWSGSINFTALTAVSGPVIIPGTSPAQGFVAFGSASSSQVTAYSGLSGPSSFGTLFFTAASNTTGGPLAIFGNASGGPEVILPLGTANNTSLSATDTWSGATFSSLGLTPGTYTYSWGTGANADSLTVQIGPVPEPSTAIVAVIGAVAFVTYGCTRHRRHQRRPAAA
jgi:hypothetical protein